MLLLKCLPLFILGILNIIVSLGVLLRDVRKLNNVFFFVLAFSIGGWVLGIAGFLLANSPDIALIWAKVYYLFPLFIASSLVMFVVSFPGYQRVAKKIYSPVIAGLILLAVPLLLNPTFLTHDVAYHDWGKEILLNKMHYLFYAVYFLSCAGFALGHIYLKGTREKGIYAAQAKLFFRGFLFTAIFGVFFNLILPWVGNYRLIHIGPLFTNIYIMAVAYSIVRHRMFDVRLVIARSVAYVLSLAVLVLGYSAFSVLAANRLLIVTNSAVGQELVNMMLLVFVALTYAPVRQFFDKFTNRIFYRDAYDPQAFLDELNKILVGYVDLEPLLQKSAEIIQKNLKAEFCLFGIKETKSTPQRILGTKVKEFKIKDIAFVRSQTPHIHSKVIVTDYLEAKQEQLRSVLQANDIAILARLINNPNKVMEGTGYILLGQKKSGNPYNNQDIKIIEIIVNELVIAIQNALRFEEIESFNITLQEKVNDATRRLRATNEKLKALDESKDEFISMASHQLRTPLTSVKGYVSMVLEGDAGKLNKAQAKLLDQAFLSSQRMVYLIADLLNVSRLKTGKFVIDRSPTNLADVVEGEISQLTEVAKNKNITLTYNKPATFPTLMLDDTKIRQVVMNFADNALYYTPTGGQVLVTLEDTGRMVEFKVTDNGLGVPKEDQHHLFTKFYRARNARKVRPDGTGLGLFMAKKVITASGGALLFTSEEGKGSTFGFTFEKTRFLP